MPMTDYECQALNELLEERDQDSHIPLLGEIRESTVDDDLCGPSSFYQDLKVFRREGKSSKEATAHEELIERWRNYDRELGDRPDYRLWRRHICQDDPNLLTPQLVEKGWKDSETAWTETSNQGLDSSSDPIVWGTVLASALSLSMTSPSTTKSHLDEVRFGEEDALDVACRMEERLAELDPLPSCTAGCAFVRLLARSSIQRLRRTKDGNRWSSLSEVENYVNDIERLLRWINSEDWEPGKSCSLNMLIDDDERTLLPLAISKIGREVGKALYRTAACIHDPLSSQIETEPVKIVRWQIETDFGNNTRGVDMPLEKRLLEKKWKFSLSAWRYIRALRKGHGRWRKMELGALQGLGKALIDSGNYVRAGAANYLLLQSIPDHLEDDERLTGMVNWACFQIRQCGLEVDPRFRKDKETSGEKEEQKEEEHPTEEADDRSKTIREFLLYNHPDWTRIQEWYDKLDKPDGRTSHWSLREMGERENVPLDVLRKGYSLALNYGYYHTAHHLLSKIDSPDPEEVENFAHHVKRAQQHMPLGFSWKKQEDWRETLKDAWLKTEDAFSPWEVLYLHEMLLGRYSVHARAAKSEDTHMYLEEHFAGAIPEDGRTDSGLEKEKWIEKCADQIFEKGPATIDPERLEKLSKGLSDGSPDGPLPDIVFASAVLRGDDNVHVLAHASRGSNTSWTTTQQSIQELTKEAEFLRRNVLSRQEVVEDQIQNKAGISFRRSLEKLRGLIISAAQEVNPDFRWLILSADPDLGLLPWQELLRQKHGTDYGVSLIPSFSWAKKSFDGRDFQWADEPEIVMGDDLGAIKLKPHIKGKRGRLRERTGLIRRSSTPSDACSVSVVVGHGTSIENGDIPSIRGPNGRPLKREEWYDLMNRRIVIVHSCWGGDAGSHRLGDWTGLSFLGLSLGSRLISAPATAIPPETAQTLHERLLPSEGGLTFGERYLKAIEEDWRVALYNLYGFGFEPLTNTDSPQ